jgi:ABC-2 type transport system ATP-binding protein
MNNEGFIHLKNLSKSYGTFLALDNINLDIVKGKVVGLLGPNGCGKTTLIKLLANLLTNYEGEILIDGHVPGVQTKKIISYLPDRNYLSNSWNANNAINFFEDFYDDFDRERALMLIRKLNIPLDSKFKSLSKGTKEKLQLILVLSRRADLYLFDEPIAGVDPAARDYIFELILENYNDEATIIITTHLVHDVEKILDQAIFLNYGRVTRFGDVDKIVGNSGKTLEDIFKEDFR